MDTNLLKNNISNIINKLKNITLNKNTNYEIVRKYTINKYFPNIPDDEKKFLDLCYFYLLDYVFKSYFDNNEDIFWEQLFSNNYQDIETIFLLLLPFLKNNKTQNINKLNELIYPTDKINIKKYKDINLVSEAKDLKYTNTFITLLNNNKYEDEMKIDYRILILTHLEITMITIRKTNFKQMINWNNFFPIKHKEINILDNKFYLPEETKLISDTMENLNKLINKNYNSKEEINQILLNPNGLWVGDIYQQIYHRYYLSVLPCKFLILPYYFNNKIYYGIEILDIILKYLTNQEEIDYNLNLYDYTNEKQDLIKLRFEKFKNSKNLLSKELNLPMDLLFNFFTRVYFYLSYYTNTDEKFTGINIDNTNFERYFYQDIITGKKGFDNEENITEKFEMETLNEIIKELSEIEFFTFINDSILKFKTTPYFRFLFNENEKIIFKSNFNNDILNLKWIYNWSKSLVHYQKNDVFSPMGKFIDIEPHKITNEFYPKLSENNTNWFNISQNIKRVYYNNNSKKELFSNSLIHKEMTKKYDFNGINIPFYLILIFDDMIRNGVLSKFIINTKLTDKTKQSANKNKRFKERGKILKELFEKNKEWENSFYYWTNKEYKTLEKYSLNPNDKEENYFKKLESFEWATYFSNDWVTQIDFYSHFLHQQVMYVTGATGQGKSTQVPKLTAYGTKAYLYKYNGHIIGTQPRTDPTRGNISWISRELGIPVLKYKKEPEFNEKQEVPTDNFYLEFKYQQDKHQKSDKTLKLTMVTDGTLLNELSNSILLKKKKKIGFRESKTLHTNLYDTVMIDEAHEHNTNMDLILSLMRQTLYYNPEIRLLIISATMDDDEPLYRSYYSLIDDNHGYPFRNLSMNPLFTDIFIDANYFDRRFHISPPGGTTQYNVEEIYLPIDGLPNDIKKASEITQEESYQVVADIAIKNPTGDILLFLNGQNEINKAVEYLNKILPKKTIALPFYTRLHPKYKKIITSIEKYIKTLKVPKLLVHEYWGEEYREDKTIQNNSYDRAVIIATNVAEASLTIKNLKFVVDNGYSKENTFDTNKGSSLEISEISESSRIQRKGRVGRVSSGKVYFMYKKNARENNPPKLKITQMNPISWMNPFIKNPNQISKNINLYKKIMPKNFDFHINLNNIKNIIKKISSNMFIIYTICQLDLFSKINYQRKIIPPELFYKTVDEYKNIDMLSDFTGNYWIVNPQENYIERNLFYDIIKYKNKIANEINEKDSKRIIDYLKTDRDIIIINDIVINSLMSNIISKIESGLEIEKSFANTILFADSFNLTLPVIMTYSIIKIIKSDLSKILSFRDFMKLKKSNKYNSDLEFLIDISNLILQNCNSKYIKNFNKYKNELLLNLQNEANKLKIKYEINPSKIEFEDRVYLKKVKSSNEWNNKNILGKIIVKTKHFKKYFKKILGTIMIPDIFNINQGLGKEIINEFSILLRSYITLKFNLELQNSPKIIKEINIIKNGLLRFKNLCSTDNQSILFCLISGKEKNTVLNLTNKNQKYLKNTFMDRNDFYYLTSFIGYSNENKTLVPLTTLQHYFSSYQIEGINYINLISNIPIEWLLILDSAYYIIDFNNLVINNNSVIFPEIKYLEQKVKNNINKIGYYWNVDKLNEIYKKIIFAVKLIKKK